MQHTQNMTSEYGTKSSAKSSATPIQKMRRRYHLHTSWIRVDTLGRTQALAATLLKNTHVLMQTEAQGKVQARGASKHQRKSGRRPWEFTITGSSMQQTVSNINQTIIIEHIIIYILIYYIYILIYYIFIY